MYVILTLHLDYYHALFGIYMKHIKYVHLNCVYEIYRCQTTIWCNMCNCTNTLLFSFFIELYTVTFYISIMYKGTVLQGALYIQD